MNFVPAPGSHLSDEDAQIVGSEIVALADTQGSVTPADIVSAARSARSPLHPYFEWDNRVAANLYRVDQAKQLIRCIMIESEDASEPVRYLHSVLLEGTPRYVTLRRVISESDLQQQIIDKALRELEGWTNRYQIYQDLRTLVSLVDKALDEVKVR